MAQHRLRDRRHLIFPALTIHRALPNCTEDKLRVSIDNRYHAIGDTVAEHMLEPHGPSRLSREDVYRGWASDDLKYFWKAYDSAVVPRDMSYANKGFAEALELARSGNEHALYRLRRTVRSDPGSPMAQDARAVLAELGLSAE